MTSVGRFEFSKTHILCQGTSSFAISERVRRLCCLVGQAEVYDQASTLLDEIGGISISGMQINRLCTYYGNLLDSLIESDCQAIIPNLPAPKSEEKVYVMVDGSMLFTRPDQWRELKLGRIFTDDNVVQLSQRQEGSSLLCVR